VLYQAPFPENEDDCALKAEKTPIGLASLTNKRLAFSNGPTLPREVCEQPGTLKEPLWLKTQGNEHASSFRAN
jgi:hypothetical protein